MSAEKSPAPLDPEDLKGPAPAKTRRRTPRRNIYFFEALLFVVSSLPLCMMVYLGWAWQWWLLGAAYLVLVMFAVHVAQQWEKVVVLRLGRFNRVEGPGIFFVIPFFESAALRIDQRIITTPFYAEKALTADLVPTDIDAVLFWMVTNPTRAWCEVNDYHNAVLWSAQTALRDAIGRTDLADISTQRYQLDKELQETLNAKTSDWGISILSVEIRNILIPEELQEAMSREAQAQQESNARLVLAEVECQVAELLTDASRTYAGDEVAFQIRMASMLNEGMKESGSGYVVVPSLLGEGFNSTGAKNLGELFRK